MKKLTIKVPATSANLGSAFDCAGIAFNIYNTFSFEKSDAFIFENFEEEFKNDNNLVLVAYKAICKKLNINSFVKITLVENNIPISRGLGSSASLIVAGAYAANKLNGNKLTDLEVLEICTEIEGHPDNVAPALLGGLCCSINSNKLYVRKFDVSSKLHFTVFIPDFYTSTQNARKALPENVSLKDAIFNSSRTMLLPFAFTHGDLELICEVTKDKLHENYRKPLYKNFTEVKEIAIDNGAISFNVSGAGSTFLAISSENIAKKIERKIAILDNNWRCFEVEVCKKGVIEIDEG